MKKIVFVLAILCFMTVINASAQKVNQKSPDKKTHTESNVIDSEDELLAASKAAALDPNIVVRKKGNNVVYLRKVIDPKTRQETLIKVRYESKTGKFVEIPKVDSKGGKLKPRG